MANSNRPAGTQLFISEDYVSDLEDQLEEKDEMVETWRTCLGGAQDFLEIVRSQFDGFDKLMEHFNDADTEVEIVVTPDEEIKFRINGSQTSQGND